MSPRGRTPTERSIHNRDSRRYRRLAEIFRARCLKVKAPCHLCGQPIDYDIPAGEPDAFEVDHFHPVDTHPHLYEDTSNFRPSHKSCNASRGNKAVVPTLGPPSEEW